jgi:hypothetical protein
MITNSMTRRPSTPTGSVLSLDEDSSRVPLQPPASPNTTALARKAERAYRRAWSPVSLKIPVRLRYLPIEVLRRNRHQTWEVSLRDWCKGGVRDRDAPI